MNLTELEAVFIGGYSPKSWHQLPTVDGAQGVMFTCPKCGGHQILCWFSNPRNAAPVPDDASPRPGRWKFTGDTVDALTLEPSVDLSRPETEEERKRREDMKLPKSCEWHGWVRNGVAE